jgi:hypothetical protein
MANFVGAVAITIALTAFFSYLIIKTDLEAIKGDWANRRCEFPVMMLAGMLKPKGESKSGLEFTKDNFSFCLQSLSQTILKTAFAPLFGILGQQANVLNTMGGPLNSIRGMLKKGIDVFGTFMDKQYRQYIAVNSHLVKVWQHLLMAMQKVQGVVFGAFFMGLSMNVLIDNMIQFVFKVIMIVIGVMVALMILLFFVLFPFIPIILSTIAILTAAGVGGAAGMAGAFCVDPVAEVKMADGTYKMLEDLELGDLLASSDPHSQKENRVTGILVVDAMDTPLVSIGGILMSGSHRVLCDGEWILAEEHPHAIEESNTKLPQLICLNTTQHEALVKTDAIIHKEDLCVGDWEEVSTEEGQKEWIHLVNSVINNEPYEITKYPTAVPLSGPMNYVQTKNGFLPIKDIKLGDYVQKNIEGDFTQVLGIYKGHLFTKTEVSTPEWISDGVWIQNQTELWEVGQGLEEDESGPFCNEGVFLVTEEEEFILYSKGNPYLVRDFSELGATRIHESYDLLDSYINKK